MHDYKDLGYRSFWTFVEAFLAVMIGSGALQLDISSVEAAGVAGIGGALTVVPEFARQ